MANIFIILFTSARLTITDDFLKGAENYQYGLKGGGLNKTWFIRSHESKS